MVSRQLWPCRSRQPHRCGGGSSSIPTRPGTPTPGTTPTPGPGGPLTPESRAAAIAAVNAQMIVFRDAGNVSINRSWTFCAPARVRDAGSVKSGGAWARFTDGQLFIVSRNFAEPDADRNAAFRYVPEGVTRAAGRRFLARIASTSLTRWERRSRPPTKTSGSGWSVMATCWLPSVKRLSRR
jgi:hypothetical protein